MHETMIDTTVNYTIEHEGRIIVIEGVPARVCEETGEQYFAPETVEHIQRLVRSNERPDRVVQATVYKYV